MAKAGTKLVVVGIAAVTAWGAWTLGTRMFGDDDAASTQHVVNQVWIERMPTGQRDQIHHLAIVDHPQGKVGIAGRSSSWRHFIEGFRWRLEGHRLSLYFPQEEARANLKVRSYDCEGEAPAPFELCLELSQGERSATYYSRRDWKIEPHDTEATLDALEQTDPNLAAVLEGELGGQAGIDVDLDAAERWPERTELPL